MKQCSNLVADRTLGQYWERQFCCMAANFGFMFSPLQIGRSTSAMAYKGKAFNCFTLPDITIWTFPGQHHEIKHKNPTHTGEFGLEVYRFDALVAFAQETRQDVMYTIHNHDLAGGRKIRTNRISDWVTASVLDLATARSRTANGTSWVNGEAKYVDIVYWPASLWHPLVDYWLECT